jgi:FkbM family methyltransferase
MELDPYDWLQSEMLLNGSTEPLTTSLYKQILKPGDVYVDVGAHVGFHTLVARKLIGDKGLVVALEPQPYNCHKILRNWIANDWRNLNLRIAAAGNRDQNISLYAQDASDSARLSVNPNNINDLPQVFYVPMIKLNTIFQELKLNKVKLVKIDVEGFELEVLRGVLSELKIVENIILEILTPIEKFSDREKEILEILQNDSFNLRNVLNQSLQNAQNLPEQNLLATKNGF